MKKIPLIYLIALSFSVILLAQQLSWATCMYAFNPTGCPPGDGCPCDCTGSPTHVRSGNYRFSVLDIQLPTRGFPISVGRQYDSGRAFDGLFGVGWTSSLTARLTYSAYLYAAPSTYYKEAYIVYPDGWAYRFQENSDGTFSPPAEKKDTLVKNGDGSFDLTLALSSTRYHFESNGSLQSMTDDYGNLLTYTYDGNGRLTRITDGTGSGRFVDVNYGPSGRISSIQDSAARSIQYIYNADGTMQKVIDAAGRETKYSYASGRFAPLLSEIRDHWNRIVTTITYHPYLAGEVGIFSYNRVKSYTEAGETYTYTYYTSGIRTNKTSSFGVWSFYYGENGKVTSRSGPQNTTTSTIYNTDGTVQMETDAVGVKTFYTYNANGSVAAITRDYQGTSPVRFDYVYHPDLPGKVTSITPKNPSTGAVLPDWQAWQYDYYPAGSTAPAALHHVYRVQSDETTLDTLTTYAYNSAGQVLTVTDGAGGVTTYTYDPTTGDLVSVAYPKNSDAGSNPVYVYGRDSIGRVTSVTDPLGKVTNYTYDNVDRITSVTLPKPTSSSPLNFVTTYTYDNFDVATGLVFTHQTDPNAKLTKQGYDPYGQMVKSIDAIGNPTTFNYSRGLLASIVDANNNTTTYNYNGLKWLTSTVFPNGSTESYTYYLDGLLNTKTDRKNQTMTFYYDKHKRMTQKKYPNNATITYGFTGQKLMSVVDNYGSETHTFAYDASYRVQSNTQGTRGTIGYTHDTVDRFATYSVSGGPSSTYTYYDDGSLKTIQWSSITGQFTYQYNLNGQYATITFPNSQTRSYNYDDQGRLLQLANTHPQVGNLGTFAYGYDNPLLGQRTSMTSALGATNYSYDSNYQLTGATYPNAAPFNGEVHAWTYDNIGNRLTNTVNASTANYSYFKNGSNPLNGQRLQSDGTKTYTYDANGNVTGDGTYTYTWDYENRLTGITGGGLTASYSYDYMGKRKSKTVNGVMTNYLYDGQNLVREVSVSTTDYVFGPRIDQPLAQSGDSGISYYSVSALRSTVALSDSSGTIQNDYKYDSWGILRSQTSSIANSFAFTSRELADAGLYFYRARYYNSTIGKFISEDPITLILPGSSKKLPHAAAALSFSTKKKILNFAPTEIHGDLSAAQLMRSTTDVTVSRGWVKTDAYNYVNNNPIRSLDPSGLLAAGDGCGDIPGLDCPCEDFCKYNCQKYCSSVNCEFGVCTCYFDGACKQVCRCDGCKPRDWDWED